MMLAVVLALMLTTNNLDAELTALFNAHLEASLKLRPLDCIRLGDYRFAGERAWPSAENHQAYVRQQKATLEKLRRFDRKSLSSDAQIDLQILERDLERSLWIEEHLRPFERDPRVFNEYISDGIFLLLTQCTLPKSEKLRLCRERIAHIPEIIQSAKASLKNPAKVLVETAIRQNRGAIGFFDAGIFELAEETKQLSSLREVCQRAVSALRGYQEFLEKDLLARADGEWRIGQKLFSEKLELELDAGITADELLAEALKEYDRVQMEMRVISRQLWGKLFPNDPIPVDDDKGRRVLVGRVLERLGKEHSTPQSVLADARRDADEIKKFISSRKILTLPDPDRCQIIEMPEFQRGNSTAYLNPAPPLDPGAASFYAISPPPKDWSPERAATLLEEYNNYMLKILTIHEAYPGHYVQLEYSNRHPSRIRRVLQSGVFIEGWAVYTEQMMLDQGFGDGDPALRLHQLKFYLRAVVNAIIDHRMHCANMSDDEVLKLLIEGAYQSEAEARLKVIRAKQGSCQLSTYFAGRTAHTRLRQAVQREMGERFELGRFHEAVLSHGSVPVKFLPELTRRTLANHQ